MKTTIENGCKLHNEYSEENLLLLDLNLQFFAKDGPGGEKTEEPTSKKLSDARKEGQVAKSKELASSASLVALFLLIKFWIGSMGEYFFEVFQAAYARFPELVKPPGGRIEVSSFGILLDDIFQKILLMILPFLAAGFMIAFIVDLMQVGWHPTAKPMMPKFDKLNPVNGIKRIFSLQSLVEFLKSVLKIAVVIIILYNDLKDKGYYLFLVYDMPLMQAIVLVSELLVSIGLKIALFFMIIAFADFGFQKWKFHEDMKMTKQEVKDEYKSQEGDPQIKGQIRRRMQEASMRRMMQNLPKADVVITNPTHYAVAIQYDKSVADAPIVIAKGADYLAQKIKDSAKEHDITIVENKPLARSLYSNVEIGEQIPPELYVAVAEILAAVYRAQGKV